MSDQWSKGDRVNIAMADEMMDGTIILASQNGRSLMLQFDGIMHGHVGQMPVLMGEDGVFRSIITGQEVWLRRKRRAPWQASEPVPA